MFHVLLDGNSQIQDNAPVSYRVVTYIYATATIKPITTAEQHKSEIEMHAYLEFSLEWVVQDNEDGSQPPPKMGSRPT